MHLLHPANRSNWNAQAEKRQPSAREESKVLFPAQGAENEHAHRSRYRMPRAARAQARRRLPSRISGAPPTQSVQCARLATVSVAARPSTLLRGRAVEDLIALRAPRQKARRHGWVRTRAEAAVPEWSKQKLLCMCIHATHECAPACNARTDPTMHEQCS